CLLRLDAPVGLCSPLGRTAGRRRGQEDRAGVRCQTGKALGRGAQQRAATLRLRQGAGTDSLCDGRPAERLCQGAPGDGEGSTAAVGTAPERRQVRQGSRGSEETNSRAAEAGRGERIDAFRDASQKRDAEATLLRSVAKRGQVRTPSHLSRARPYSP